MAIKKTYGTARAFTEGHLKVLGDQSVEGKFDEPPEDPKVLASYAKQRAFNAKPFAERKGNDIYARDNSFKARLSRWEANQGGNNIHSSPKPVDLGKDRGGNQYQRSDGRNQSGGASAGSANERVDQAIWKDGRDGRPLTKRQKLLDQKDRDGIPLTRRQKADQYSAQQPYAKNERRTGVQGSFGILGNFFNEDD